MKALMELYIQQFKTTMAAMFQYRASLLIWMIGQMLEPLVYLIVWSVVSTTSGGSVGDYTTKDFAGYFIVLMLVNQFTYTWIMYEFEYRVREGILSFALLKPVHPIHSDIADNISSKFITLPVMILIAVGLAFFFNASIAPAPWAIALFIPVLLVAFTVRFLLEWTLSLVSFWITRVGAINQTYFVLMLFLSGQIAPLTLLPFPVQIVADILPFRWIIGFPVELLLGRLTLMETLIGLGAQIIWLLISFVTAPNYMACRITGLFGGGSMNFFRLLAAFFTVSVMGEIAYRVNFFVQLFQSILSMVVSLGGLAVIFSYTDTLGGWRPDEILTLVGVYFLVGGIIGLIIQPGMEKLIESVRDGTLDFTLTKPEDTQLIVSIGRIDIWKLIDIVLGLIVIIIALTGLGVRVGIWQAGMFILMLIAGMVIIYSFFLILATLSFWFVRVENILVIFQSMYEAGRWPISLYPGWLRYGLTFIVPVAFATTIPAEALTGRLELGTILGTVGLALLLLTISRIVWRVGLHHYSGASA